MTTPAVYPPVDADHIVQWDFAEQLSDLTFTLDPNGAHVPPWFGEYAPFVDVVGGYSLKLYDTFPTVAASKFYEIGAPGPFGGSVLFKGGTGTNERDYLYGAGPEQAAPITIDLWVRPFGTASNVNIIQKEYSASAWAAPFVALQLWSSATFGEWGVNVSISGTSHGISNIGHGNSVQHLRLIYGIWNHIGLTYDGTTLRAYINGILADELATSGAIDYGAHGLWALGASRAIGGAGLDAFNGNIGRTRISKVARGLGYFFNSYQGAITALGGVTGGVVLAPPPITIVGRGLGGIGLGLS